MPLLHEQLPNAKEMREIDDIRSEDYLKNAKIKITERILSSPAVYFVNISDIITSLNNHNKYKIYKWLTDKGYDFEPTRSYDVSW